MEEQSLDLHADSPAETEQEDILGRRRFAGTVASAIRGNSEKGICFAVYGEWGMGKTTVKNYVVEELANSEIEVVQFEPWQFESWQQLVREFFIQLGRQAQKAGGDKNIAKQTYLYGLAVIDLMGLSAAAIEVFPPSPEAALIAKFFNKVIGPGKAFVRSLRRLTATRQLDPLSELKARLAASFRNLRRPLLVVIDDVDRLFKNEIQVLMRLVKANADLPNVNYLLLFQRDVVESALQEAAGDGEAFLEKIVQVGFTLPPCEPQVVNDFLMRELESIFRADIREGSFDSDTWLRLWYEGLFGKVISLRDAKRFLNDVVVQRHALCTSGEFSGDFLDLVLLSVLRTQFPATYQRLADNAPLLVESGGMDRSARYQTDDEFNEMLIEDIDKADRNVVQIIIGCLFPTLSMSTGIVHRMHGSEGNWLSAQRICHSAHIYRYFGGDGRRSILVTDFCRLRSALADGPSALRDALLKIAHRAGNMLALRAAWAILPQDHQPDLVEQYAVAISKFLEDSDCWREARTMITPEAVARSVVHEAILGLPDAAARAAVIRACIAEGTTVLVAHLLFESTSPTELESILGAELAALRKECGQAISQQFKRSPVETLERWPFLLFRWRDWGSPAEVTEFVCANIEEPRFLIALAKIFATSQVKVTGIRLREVEVPGRIYGEPSEFVSLDAWDRGHKRLGPAQQQKLAGLLSVIRSRLLHPSDAE